MKYCSKCGTQINDDEKLCPDCAINSPVNAYRPSGRNGAANDADARENKTMGIMAYCSFLVVIPLFTAKESRFARYHTNQGLTLALIELVYGIIVQVVSSAMTSSMIRSGAWLRTSSWGAWSIVNFIIIIGWVLLGILSLIGLGNARKGICKPLPIFGGIKLLK